MRKLDAFVVKEMHWAKGLERCVSVFLGFESGLTTPRLSRPALIGEPR